MKARRLFLFLIIFVSSATIYAQTNAPSSPGLSILDISFGARGLALGEAMQAVPGDRFSIYNNPASSALAEQTVLIAGGQNMNLLNSIGFIGVFPFKFGTITLGIKGAAVDGIEIRPDPSNPDAFVENTSVLSATPAMSYARTFASLSVGLAAKITAVSLGYNYYTKQQMLGYGLAFDLGAYYEIDNLGIGLVAQNIGTKLSFSGLGNDTDSSLQSEGCAQPLCVIASVRYSVLENKLNLLAGTGYATSRGLLINCGLEYMPWQILALRIGYNIERVSGFEDAINGLATGFGLRLANLEINYSYLPNRYLGNGGIHGIDIGFHFGTSQLEREKLLAEARAQAEKEALERQKLTSQSLYEQGMSQYNMSRYDEALSSWDLALIWWPDNTQAQTMIEKVSQEKESMELEAMVNEAKQAYVSKNYVALLVLSERILAQDSTHSLAKFYLEKANTGVTEELIASAPTVIQDDLRKGIKALAAQNYLAAMRSFETVLDYDPGNKVAQDYIGKTQAQVSEYIDNEIKKVNSLIARSRYNEAKTKVRKLLKIAPKNTELLQKLGEIDRKLNEDVQRRIARAKETNDPARSEKELKAALQLDPGNLKAQEDLKKVEKTAKTAADAQKLYLLGVESYSENNYEVAINYWQRVLAINPNHANARKNLARAQSKLKALGGK